MVFGDIAPLVARRSNIDRRTSLMATSSAVPRIDQMPFSSFMAISLVSMSLPVR